jgi:hypothetical protein
VAAESVAAIFAQIARKSLCVDAGARPNPDRAYADE